MEPKLRPPRRWPLARGCPLCFRSCRPDMFKSPITAAGHNIAITVALDTVHGARSLCMVTGFIPSVSVPSEQLWGRGGGPAVPVQEGWGACVQGTRLA